MDRNGLKWTQKGLTWIKRDKNCVLEEKIPFSSNFYGGNEGTPHPRLQNFLEENIWQFLGVPLPSPIAEKCTKLFGK